MTRFYIGLSIGQKSDGLTYPVKRIMSAVSKIGGENVRSAKYMGEDVVTFDAPSHATANLFAAHASAMVYPQYRSSVLAAYKKNW